LENGGSAPTGNGEYETSIQRGIERVSGSLIALEGVARPYAWGSPTAIPQLRGVPASGEPVAELWFDEKLPFLLKILAADQALSIQVHPNLEQAQRGFAAEEALGIPRDAPHRNYRDANHKPELICALGQFDALVGFRPVAQTLEFFRALDVPELGPVAEALAGPDGLRAAFTMLLTLPEAERPQLVAQTLAGCQRLIGAGGEWWLAAQASVLAAEHFPRDIGVVIALLLNAIRLEAGEAIFLPAGNVHAYLRGIGVEIMANSDNVLRCGLTPKHVDVDEVLRISDFSELADPRCPSQPVTAHEKVFATSAADFELSMLTLGPDEITEPGTHGPELLLCTEGAVTLEAGAEHLLLPPGRAVLLAAGLAARIRGVGTLFRATKPA
jgi:mannose-6-phosphate isomerase